MSQLKQTLAHRSRRRNVFLTPTANFPGSHLHLKNKLKSKNKITMNSIKNVTKILFSPQHSSFCVFKVTRINKYLLQTL